MIPSWGDRMFIDSICSSTISIRSLELLAVILRLGPLGLDLDQLLLVLARPQLSEPASRARAIWLSAFCFSAIRPFSSFCSSLLSSLTRMSPFVHPRVVIDQDLADDAGHRRVDLVPFLGEQRAVALDRQGAGDERHGGDERQHAGQHGADLGQGPAPEHPPGRAERLQDRLQEDLVVFLGIPERRRGVPRDDLGPGVHVGRRQLVADLLGHQAAERDLLLACSVPCSRLGLVQERDDHDLRPRFVDVHLERVANVGRQAVGVAGVDQVFARADHDLAEPGQLAHQVGPLLDDLLAADGLDHGPAGDLERDA